MTTIDETVAELMIDIANYARHFGNPNSFDVTLKKRNDLAAALRAALSKAISPVTTPPMLLSDGTDNPEWLAFKHSLQTELPAQPVSTAPKVPIKLGPFEHSCKAVTGHRGGVFVCQMSRCGVSQDSYCSDCPNMPPTQPATNSIANFPEVQKALIEGLANGTLQAQGAQPAPAPGYCKNCKDYTIEEPLIAQPVSQTVEPAPVSTAPNQLMTLLHQKISAHFEGCASATFGWQASDPNGREKAQAAHHQKCIDLIYQELQAFGASRQPAAVGAAEFPIDELNRKVKEIDAAIASKGANNYE